MGITRIADVTGLDTIGIPVVMVCRPNARSVSVSQGKGCTLAAAKASGLMESIEGYHAEHISSPLRMASFVELQSAACTIDPATLPRIKNTIYHPNYPITWVESTDLMNGQPTWVPFEMVHTNYTLPRPSGTGCFPASSNGLASGNSIAEAAVHAICEVIERDALSLWHQRGALAFDKTSIDPASVSCQRCVETLEKLDTAAMDVFIWDITSDISVPTYCSVIMDRDSQAQHIGVGSGTHLSRDVALLRALHEAVQVRTTYIAGVRDDITSEEYTREGMQAKMRFFGKLVRQSSFSGKFTQSESIDTDSPAGDLSTLLAKLKKAGISQVSCVDISKPEFNVPVVRIVIPGLEPPHDEESYMPGERALRARQARVG